jgi:phage tail sheath protein FI
MPTYLTPGIYMEEVSSGPKPIQAEGTSTAAFVGPAPNPMLA